MPDMPEKAVRITSVIASAPPTPYLYTFRLDQFRITNTRAVHNDTDVVGFTLKFGSQSYTQALNYGDVNNGNHDLGLEFPVMQIVDPTTVVTLAFSIVNAGNETDQVVAVLQKGVDQAIKSGGGGGKGGQSGNSGGTGGSSSDGSGASAFGTIEKDFASTGIDLALKVLFANCDGSVASDMISTPMSNLDALIPSGAHTYTETIQYAGSNSNIGCGGNSDYYVTWTLIRTQPGQAHDPAPGIPFKILSVSSGLLLDVPDGAATQGEQIQQWAENGAPSEIWELETVAGGYYMIRSTLTGLVLQVKGNSKDDHAPIQQATATSAENQHWTFEPVTLPPHELGLPTVTYYKIKSRSSGKVLDVPGHSADGGAKLWQYTDQSGNYHNNQMWQLLQAN